MRNMPANALNSIVLLADLHVRLAAVSSWWAWARSMPESRLQLWP